MKFIPILLFFFSFSYAKIHTVVSILPEKTFVEAIGQERVEVALMVEPNASPHTYEPKPSQMLQIANASLYFAIGVEFEKVWMEKFSAQNPKMRIVDISQGVSKIGTQHKDPHIWTDPKNVQTIAKNICQALIKIDAKHASYYQQNLKTLLANLKQTDAKIQEILAPFKGAKFMVFHPSWGYFAKAYNLIQVPIEIEGKEPKPSQLLKILTQAKKDGITTLFVQPKFSNSMAKVVANELNLKVIKVSPLAPNYTQNLTFIANEIARGLND